MFTVKEIQEAHAKVKSGADFPKYIQEIKKMGVTGFETWVKDSHTNYLGNNDFSVQSNPKYDDLTISDDLNKEEFARLLKIHQQGETDYFTFCNHCAETGVEKWIVDLDALTCTYYDKKGDLVLTEQIPS